MSEAVLFISFGGPEKSEDIMPFLERVTSGRGIPKERLTEVAHHYEQIGGASPINAITRRQAEAVQAQLKNGACPWPVYIGQRNWHPLMEDTLRQMTRDGIKRAVGFVTAAHRCEASWERYVADVETASRRTGASPIIDYVDPWFDHPLFIEAISDRVRSVAPIDKHPAWIFTAHSIPTPMAQASRYVEELETTARLVAQRLGQPSWSLAYTSRSGRPQDPWLEPDVSDVLRDLKKKGVQDVLVIPIGFVADHVEVLFDLGIEAKQTAENLGLGFTRAPTVGDHPAFIRLIAELISQRAAPQSSR